MPINPDDPHRASSERGIRITTVAIILDKPADSSVFVKISVDGEDAIYRQHSRSTDDANNLKLRWVLAPFVALQGGSRLVVQLCQPGFFWGHYVVVGADITAEDALRLRSNATSQGPQEIQLRDSPAIAIEFVPFGEPGPGTQAKTSEPAKNARPFKPTTDHSKPTVAHPGPNNSQSNTGPSTHQPGLNKQQPGPNKHQPGPSTHQPGLNKQQPGPNNQPGPSIHQAGLSAHQPSANRHQPGPSIHQPGLNKHQPSPNKHQHGPSTQPKPSTRQPGPSPRQAAHNTRPAPAAKARAEASQLFDSSLLPGVGASLRRIRLETASRLLRQAESQCGAGELAQVKNQLLNIQCEAVDLFRQGDMGQQDVRALFARIDEVLDIWAWRRAHLRAGFFDEVVFRTTLATLPAVARTCAATHNMVFGLQSLLARSSVAADPTILPLRIELSHIALEDTFHQAIRHFEAARWAPAMSLLKSQDSALDVLMCLEDAFRGAQAANGASHPLVLYEPRNAVLTRTEFDMQLAICRTSQLLHTGDLHFKAAETGVAEDMMGHAQLAQDDYRAALSCVTGQDVELEGATIARLARFYAKVVKQPVPAHQLYLRAVQLAACLAPAIPRGAWYRESVDAIQAHRDALEAQEAREWTARRAPILERLAADIEKLRGGKHMGNREFCEFVFRAWPPKTEGAAQVEPSPDPLDPHRLPKNQLLKVIRRYHTDRNSGYGEDWLVLCEEISKELTARYNIIKGVD